MNTGGRLIAGSHNRNEFVLINADEIGRKSNQACPQCKTRYKRIKGSPLVEGDEEEDGTDDIEHEQHSSTPGIEIPLLTYGEEDAQISSDQHALIVPPSNSFGDGVYPTPHTESPASLHPRPMVPQKDVALYGYGSVAWKDRMEDWKKKQNEKKFGQSPVFVASTLLEYGGLPKEVSTSSLLKEAIHVISCGYEGWLDLWLRHGRYL
ncbi:hypothetical protein K7X08_002995 [Anisodus acutangulus]|uniref:Cellulose synthase n=1 Tax=Anisodus acutangulus TaxID=402998 RepID=A0A9Q1RI95_9SOLA|nr:hypothetical protein K7X08_002995 [Anisodus acutangulus]